MAQTTIPFTLYGGKVVGRFVENKETGYHAYFVNDEERGIKNARPTGVTTILGIKDKSRALLSWATGLARDHLEQILLDGKNISIPDIYEACRLYEVRKREAANIGDQIHNWCEGYIKWRIGLDGFAKPEIPKDKAIQLGVIAFLDWEADHKVKFFSSERIIYSRKFEYIGKGDFDGEVDGRLSFGDLKTGNGLYNSVRAQTAPYVRADEEEQAFIGKPKKYLDRWAIRLSKETKEEYDARMAKKGLRDWPDYQVFEAMKFGDEDIDEDMQSFLSHKFIYDWDKKTDFYRIKQAQKSIVK